MNVAIIEDEPAIARELEFLLHELDFDIDILQTIGTVKDAVHWLKDQLDNCNLLFMDIRLTDGVSFEIFNEIEPKVPVIFITAYDDYALEAFKVNGIDYILKPFEKKDLKNALDKFRRLRSPSLEHFHRDNVHRLLEYFKVNSNEKDYKEAYLVHYQNKLIPVQVQDIQWFYTEQEIVYAITKDKSKFIIDSTLERIQSEVSPKEFYRANRQFIIQRNAVKDIDFYFNGRLLVNVWPKPDEKVIVSKAKATDFKTWLNH